MSRIKKADVMATHAAVSRAARLLHIAGPFPEVQEALQNALAIIGPWANPKRPRGRAGGRRSSETWEYHGQQLGAHELAKLAGCNRHTMVQRLTRVSAAEAVAMGPACRYRQREAGGKFYRNEIGAHPSTKFYDVGGERLSIAQMAERAGCKRNTMRTRLTVMSPERALQLGASGKPEPKPKPEPTPKAVEPAKKPGGSEEMAAKSWSIREKKLAPPASLKVSAPSGPIVVLPGAKITRAAPIPDRFAVDPRTCPPIFSGQPYGQYEDTGTAIARQYG